MAVWKVVGKGAAVLAAGIFTGTLLLVLAYMLPVNTDIRDASYEILDKEGWYPRTSVVSYANSEYFHSLYPDVLDNSTDMIMLYTAMDASEGSPLYRAMNSYSAYTGVYNYYWHGYVSILRPLCLFLDFSELRLLNGACQLLLVLLMAYMVGKAKGVPYVMALLTSYLLLNPTTVSMGLQFTWVFYVAWGGALLLFCKGDFFSRQSRYIYVFIVIGMCTSYLDLLTYPLFTWGFPLIWWLVADGGSEKGIQWLKRVVYSGFGWIAGYAVMWVSKWLLSTIVLGTNVFESAVNEVFLLSGTLEGKANSLADRLEAAYINWKHYNYKVYAVILICWLVWWIVTSIRKGWRRSAKRYALFLVGVSSIVWYFTLTNHTLWHHFFTYRIFGVSVLAFLVLALDGMPDLAENTALPGETGGKGKGRLRLCCLVGISALLAVPCTMAVREKLTDMNGTSEFRQIPLEHSLEMEFTPAFGGVTQFYLGLECLGAGGQFDINLWEGDDIIYCERLSIENGKEDFTRHYHAVDVSWKLDAGKPYRITVEKTGSDDAVLAWVTEGETVWMVEGEAPQGSLAVDGAETDGHLLMGVEYYALGCASKGLLLFVWLTWLGVFLAVFYTFWPEGGLRLFGWE